MAFFFFNPGRSLNIQCCVFIPRGVLKALINLINFITQRLVMRNIEC